MNCLFPNTFNVSGKRKSIRTATKKSYIEIFLIYFIFHMLQCLNPRIKSTVSTYAIFGLNRFKAFKIRQYFRILPNILSIR